MNIKTDDLELLLWYLKKEKADHSAVMQVTANFELIFEFKDEKGRDCEIIIYDMQMRNKPVRLKKEMDLETRLEKEDKE
jgi:hypothetical protein